ncbi:MAG: trypsin-like peptidase domain-containing protein [Acidobacteria bacterium]|nr:trypsin-like peptidase domain-containing protein [Acidobacteriota bacterium]
MTRLMFVYLSGTEKGKTRIFKQEHVTIGSDEHFDLMLVPEEGGSLPAGLIADIYSEDDGTLTLMPRYKSDFLEFNINGEVPEDSPTGYELRDGDTLHFGQGLSSASFLFQIMPENFSTASLVRQQNRVAEAAQTSPATQPVHPLTATLFVKELSASLWAEVPKKAKLFGLAAFTIIVLALVAIIFSNFLILHRNTSQIELLRKQAEEAAALRQKDQELIKIQQDKLQQLQDVTEQSRQFTQKITEQYAPGVCLIVGSYTFAERGTGKLLRYESADGANGTPVDKSGNLLASVDGAGPPVQIDYSGTGFVIKQGLIATNRHIVRPWATDNIAQLIMGQGNGFRPQLDRFVAFFPAIKKQFALKEALTSDRYDIALCSFEQGDAALPELPLSNEDPSGLIGAPVVLLGYPTGVDGLLQRIDDESIRREIMKQHGTSAEDVAIGLAGRGLIRPLTTTGNITDALPGKIVHSAQTTEGGSGSPMFNRDGKVIAINSAILTTIDGEQSFGGSNFGVPIKATYEMLLAYRRP